MITITIAGEKKQYEEGITIEKLVAAEKVETPQYVTVSLNESFVEHKDFATTALRDGDEVEFLYFMGGGR